MDNLTTAFAAAVNLAPEATELVGAKALTASTTGNPSTFNLDDLDKHGSMYPRCLPINPNLSMVVWITFSSLVIEHDGSLSRADIYFGDNHSFNRTIWDSIAAHFTSETISIATAAAARSARLTAAAAVNPVFNMSATDVEFSLIESALYLSVFGNATTGNAVTEWVKTMFRKFWAL